LFWIKERFKHRNCKVTLNYINEAGQKKQWISSKTLNILSQTDVRDKAILVTRFGGPQGCETSRLPHYLRQLTIADGGEVTSLTRRVDYWYSFLLPAE
jgi:hypothetical protein